MDLYLIRHAPAEPRDADRADAARALTPRGAKKWARAVRGLKRLGVRLDRLYHSPWLRAVQTAEALTPLVTGETVVTTRLTEAPSRTLLDELGGASTALVGHEPWMSQLLALLVLDGPAQGPRFVLRKGGVAWLSGEPTPGGMTLKALFPPKALRAIARR
jgi:phosphohistidine phosphatase